MEALKERNIQVVLTIVHGTVPQWFSLKGAFENMDNLKYFERYLEYIVPQISQYIDYWCVFNEFNSIVTSIDHKYGSIRFHARANSIIKKYSNSPVSTAHAFRQMYAKRQNDLFDLAVQNYHDVITNEFWFHAIRTGEIVLPDREAFYDPEIKGSCDYWAVNTYWKTIIDTRLATSWRGKPFGFNKVMVEPNMAVVFDPECFIQNFLRLKDKPVLITENGICSRDDRYRIVWILEYLSAVKECLNLGIDIRGYLHWSLIDNYEWGSYDLKFGLVDVDFENDFKRTIKPSAYFYRDIIENNGYKKEMLEKYLKEAPNCKNQGADIVHFIPDNV